MSPPLAWTKGPKDTKTYALAFKDTTAVKNNIDPSVGYQWVMWNIPLSVNATPENMSGGIVTTVGGLQSSPLADDKFFGPCPSWNYCDNGEKREEHSYEFALYAVGDAFVQGDSPQARTLWLEENAIAVDRITVKADAAPSCEPKVIDGATIWDNQCVWCHTRGLKAQNLSQIKAAFEPGGRMSFLTVSDEQLKAVSEFLKIPD